MSDNKNENEPKVAERLELTKEELQILINVIAQASVRLVDAPVLIALSNKLSKMVDNVKPRL